MATFITINKNFTSGLDFWILNPILTITPPFNKLYKRDKSKNKEYSSKEMYAIYFIEEVDETLNLFARYSYEDTLKMLKDDFSINVDMNDEVFKECQRAYPDVALTTVEKSLKDLGNFINKRKDTLLKMEVTLENIDILDKAMARNLKIYQDYEKVLTLFNHDKKKTIVRGGRDLSMSEQGLL